MDYAHAHLKWHFEFNVRGLKTFSTIVHTGIVNMHVNISGPVELHKHLSEHADQKDHLCTTCDKSFVHEVYLEQHQKQHKAPKICGTCGKR